MTSYAIRVDENLKAGASEVARSFGLDLASVTRAFWTYMVRTGSIPGNSRDRGDLRNSRTRNWL